MISDKARPTRMLVKWFLHSVFTIVGIAAVGVIPLLCVACTSQSGAQIEQTRVAVLQVTQAADNHATQQAQKATIATATTRPTLVPTAKLTTALTATRTLAPTTKPTLAPTAIPTRTPTDSPTLEPTAIPEPISTKEIIRPATHIIKETGIQDAAGELTINNNSQYDGLVILATYELPNSPIASGVIRTGESLKIVQVPDGVYRLYFCTGSDWLPELNQFDTVISYQSFEDAFEYTTSTSEYTSWEVTLAPIEDGNASSVPVSPDDFPSAN